MFLFVQGGIQMANEVIFWCVVFVVGLSVEIGIIAALFMPPLFRSRGGIDGMIRHLHQCVVEGKCQRGDSKIHVMIEHFVWYMYRKFGRPGLFVGCWLEVYRSLILLPFRSLSCRLRRVH